MADQAAADALDARDTVTDSFNYTLSDGTATDTATITITITGVDDDITAVDDTDAVDEDGSISRGAGTSYDLDSDDEDPDEDDTTSSSTITAIRTGSTEGSGTAGSLGSGLTGTYGTLTVNSDGSYSYVADQAAADDLDLNDTAIDYFNYTVTSGSQTDIAVLAITVTGINDAPVAANDTGSVDEDATLTVSNGSGDLVENNDTDPDDSASLVISAIRVGGTEGSGTAGTIGSGLTGTYGTITVNANGSYTYIADQAAADALDAGDTVTDVFNYTVSDGTDTDMATITITVNGVDDDITAVNDTDAVDENASISRSVDTSYDIDSNDTDPDDSSSSTITGIRIGSTEDSGVPGTIGSGLIGTYGTLTLNANGSYSYAADQSGADALDAGDTAIDYFNYTVTSGSQTDTAVIAITVTGINDAPVAVDDTDVVLATQTITRSAGSSYDIDSDESSLTLMVEDGDGYSVEVVEAGYKIIADENVTDTLYVPSTISDGDSLSNVWDLLVVVLPSNDAPIVVTAVNDIIVDEDADEVILSLLGSETSPYFYDSDGDSLNFDVFTNGSGVVSAFAASDSLYLSFYPNLSGQDTVFVVATDPSGDDVMDSIVVTVNTVNDSPEIVDAPSFEILEDDSIDVFIYQFVIRDPDTQLELITLDITAEDDTDPVVNHYTITPIEYGFRIVPNENCVGDMPLVVKANECFSMSDPFYVSVHVMPVNDAPMIIMPLADIVGEEDSDSIVVNLGGSEAEPYFVDLDGDSIEFGIEAANNDIFDWSLDGYDLKIIPMINMYGVDTLHIVGTDGSGAFVYDTVLVTINSVNDAPSAFTLITPEDSLEVVITAASATGGATIDVSWTMSEDVDGDSVGYGFILYNGPYALETPALYTANAERTELSIYHTSARALLEPDSLQ